MGDAARRARLRFVRRITRRHGAAFAARVLADLRRSGESYDAYSAAAIVAWPRGAEDHSPAEVRYLRIENEILARTFAAVEDALAAAFVQAAREVVERERALQRKREK